MNGDSPKTAAVQTGYAPCDAPNASISTLPPLVPPLPSMPRRTSSTVAQPPTPGSTVDSSPRSSSRELPADSLAVRRFKSAASRPAMGMRRRSKSADSVSAEPPNFGESLLASSLSSSQSSADSRTTATPTKSDPQGARGSTASSASVAPSFTLSRSKSHEGIASTRSLSVGMTTGRTHPDSLPSPSLGRLPLRSGPPKPAQSVASPPPASSRPYAPTIPSPLAHSHTHTNEFPFPSSPLQPVFEMPQPSPPLLPGPSPTHADSASTSTPTSKVKATSQTSPTPLSQSFSSPRHHVKTHSSSSHPERMRTRSDGHMLAGSSPPMNWRSSSSSSSRSASRGRPPLTPPESLGIGRHLTNAADLAWNDVLGGLGTLNFAGVDFGSMSGGAAGATSGSSTRASVPHVHDLMALENGNIGGSGGNHNSSQAPVVRSERRSTPTDQGNGQRVGNEELMLGSGGGHFGPATRERLAQVIEKHLANVPLKREDELLHLVEYGALNSRSAALMAPVISHFAVRHEELTRQVKSPPPRDGIIPAASGLNFQVTHADRVDADFRALSSSLDSNPESYLNSHWLSSHNPSLEDRVFSAFSSRPFAAKVAPKASVSFGFSAMALHWLSTDKKYRIPPATLAHGELMAFLSARASEFKVGGLFVMAYISRSDRSPHHHAAASYSHTPTTISSANSSTPSTPNLGSSSHQAHQFHASNDLHRGASMSGVPSHSASSSPAMTAVAVLQAQSQYPSGTASVPVTPSEGVVPSTSAANDDDNATRPEPRERSTSSPTVPNAASTSKRDRDIWDVLSGLLAKAIQRLVSTQLLKPAVARLLLSLPIHPRTPKQTHSVLSAPATQHCWLVEEQETLTIPHPAWKGLEHKTVSAASYADHTIQLLKIFWESEIRTILRDALLSRAASEWILDSLWTICREKVEEEGPQPLELEVQIVALRRRGADAPPSAAASAREEVAATS